MPLLPKEVLFAMERLEQHGFEAYAVGGCVRDSLLGRTPNDWDLTTSALPEETAACFSDCRVIETGVQHGTVTVNAMGMLLEITTYRLDGAYKDNRHPESVSFSKSLSDDLARRDFTVNAMAYRKGDSVVDLFGGRQDLKDGLIRCVGDPKTRFEEDGLRILRALRFASVLGFELEPKTAEAVHLCKDLLCNIAGERIRDEFRKLICGSGAVEILRNYVDVITVFLPQIAPCVGFEQNSKYHCYDVWEHTLQALSYNHSDDFTVRMTLLLHDIGKPFSYTEDEEGGHFKGHAIKSRELAEEIFENLRFDHKTRDLLLLLIRNHDAVLIPEPKYVKRALLKYGEEGLLALLEVMRCDRLAHAEPYRTPPAFLEQVRQVLRQIQEENSCLTLKKLAINGDILQKNGFRAGKALGSCLQYLLDAVIDGELENETSALLEAAKAYQQEHGGI